MPERTDMLCSYLKYFTKVEYDLIVIDNGSDLVNPSYYTTLRLPENVQTTRGWLSGLRIADMFAESREEPYFAYVIGITSARLVGNEDHLSMMLDVLLENDDAVGVLPAITSNSDIEVWKHMLTRGGDAPRMTWGLDNIFTMWRRDWFDSIGQFDSRLIYAWGLAEETSWKARSQGKSLWIHEGCKVEKLQDIGYKMDRMNMGWDDRRRLGMENVMEIMEGKYGKDWMRKLTEEFVEDAWR